MTMNPNHPAMLTTWHGVYPVYSGPILPEWVMRAHATSFEIVARIIDRLHVALRCHTCGAVNRVRVFTLRANRPRCHACIEAAWRAEASRAGLEFLRRDPVDHHYGIYRAPCGHVLRRQFELIERAALGETGVRCETCHAARERAEAQARGWTLVGPDPKGDPGYRLYSHDTCGHRQRIARANMQSARFACGGCSTGWLREESRIYLMRFTLENSHEVVKLGYSNDPESRLHGQLVRNAEMPCEILHEVIIPTGQQAQQLERRLHAKLRRNHPAAVIDPKIYHDQIKVGSEVYETWLMPTILAELDQIDTALCGAAA